MIRKYEKGDFLNIKFIPDDALRIIAAGATPESLDSIRDQCDMYTLIRKEKVYAIFGIVHFEEQSEVFVFRDIKYKSVKKSLARGCKDLLELYPTRKITMSTSTSQDMVKWATFLGFTLFKSENDTNYYMKEAS